MDVPLTLKEVTKLFHSLTAGEEWSGRLSLEVSRQILRPHLAYYVISQKGRICIPPHGDRLAVAGWIAHEAGHFAWYQKNQPPAFRDWLEMRIRAKSTPFWLQNLLRNFHFIWYWRLRLREEIYAHSVELHLLMKAGISLEAVRCGYMATDALTPATAHNGFVQRLFRRTVQRLQNLLTQEAMMT